MFEFLSSPELDTLQRRVHKQIALIGLIGTLCYAYLFLQVWALPVVGKFDLLCCIIFVYFYLRAHFIQEFDGVSRYGALLFFIMQLFVTNFVFLGSETGLHFYMMAVCIALLLSTPLDHSLLKYLSVGLSIALFFAIEFIDLDNLPLYTLSQEQNRSLYLSTMIAACTGLCLISLNVGALLREGHQSLRHSAFTDELSGLGNRRRLFEQFNAIDSAMSNASVSLVLFDVDHFKQINDRFGHAYGDKVIQMVSDKLSRCAPLGSVIARIGGEEFCLLINGATRQQISELADQIRIEVEKHVIYCDQRPISCTISAGVAQGGLGSPMSVTLSQADQALYQAKRRGRNQVLGYGFDVQRYLQ